MTDSPSNVPNDGIPLDTSETQVQIDGDGLLAGKLDEVGSLALDWCTDILKYPLPPKDDEAFGILARAKGVAAQTGLHTLMRVNEMRLKRQALGRLPELLRRIREEQTKIKAITNE